VDTDQQVEPKVSKKSFEIDRAVFLHGMCNFKHLIISAITFYRTYTKICCHANFWGCGN